MIEFMNEYPIIYSCIWLAIVILLGCLAIYAYDIGFKRGKKDKYVPKCMFGRPLTLESAKTHVGKGWETIVEICYNACVENEVDIHQIKEKLGGLRFYVGAAPDLVHEIIEAAERLSYITCENCGKPGKPRKGGWVKTLCDNCTKVRREERDKW